MLACAQSRLPSAPETPSQAVRLLWRLALQATCRLIAGVDPTPAAAASGQSAFLESQPLEPVACHALLVALPRPRPAGFAVGAKVAIEVERHARVEQLPRISTPLYGVTGAVKTFSSKTGFRYIAKAEDLGCKVTTTMLNTNA